MLQTRRQAVRLLRQHPQVYSRTYAESSSSSSSSSHASPSQHHPPPAKETLGRGFYIAISAIALSFAAYKYNVSSSSGVNSAADDTAAPFITRFIRQFSSGEKEDQDVNNLHSDALEQAAHARLVFAEHRPSPHVNLRFPEVFNTGSPFNIPAGHNADLSAIQGHYRKKQAEDDEREAKRIEERKQQK